MSPDDLVRLRLRNQRLDRPVRITPARLVWWLGAVQAQDYAGAKWGLGLRLSRSGEAEVEKAFASGAILRTHVLRPTWHFVTPQDIGWMLELTAPRVHAANAGMVRNLGLSPETFRLSEAVLRRTLRGGSHLTRKELRAVLQKSGVECQASLRMGYLLMHAELEGLICSGPRRGKQFTYALLEERAPQAHGRSREDALRELSRRYIQSRGPATVRDFARWSGLTIAAAAEGLESIGPGLRSETLDGQAYWFPRTRDPRPAPSPSARLLSIYDEYISGYRDRSAMIESAHAARLGALGNALTSIVLLDGRIVGTWKRTLRGADILIHPSLFVPLRPRERAALSRAAGGYGTFLGLRAFLRLRK